MAESVQQVLERCCHWTLGSLAPLLWIGIFAAAITLLAAAATTPRCSLSGLLAGSWPRAWRQSDTTGGAGQQREKEQGKGRLWDA